MVDYAGPGRSTIMELPSQAGLQPPPMHDGMDYSMEGDGTYILSGRHFSHLIIGFLTEIWR